MTKSSRKNRTGGRAVFYHRDSSGRHDQTPGQYVQWAARDCVDKDLIFDGSADLILSLIHSGEINCGDIYLDYDIQGHLFQRPALDALLQRIDEDMSVSDLYIHNRERFSRPDDPLDAVGLENHIRRNGVRIHYSDLILEPIARGQRAELGETLTAVVRYDASGKYRRDLANKVIPAQINLAISGFSTGGRAPFFLQRWLVDVTGKRIRPLQDGEIVRMAGHHVIWLPGDQEKWQLALRIIEMLETMPATEVARVLTLEEIPSPDTGRTRTEKRTGICHEVSGVWHATTVVNVARSMLLLGKPVYGRRSMGDQRRFSPTGPRDLGECDYRDDNKPKVIHNPSSSWIVGPANFDAPFSEERILKLLAILDERAGTQKGKPRSPNRDQNPLGVRIFDMDCGWPMYREPYKLKGENTFRYACGAYSQTHGVCCAHNTIDGPLAAAFCWNSIAQRISSPTFIDKLKARLMTLISSERKSPGVDRDLVQTKRNLVAIRDGLAIASQNLARARNDEQYDAVSSEFDQLKAQEAALVSKIESLERSKASSCETLEQQVDAAMRMFDSLSAIAKKGANYSVMQDVFGLANLRLFVRFKEGKWGKRPVRRVAGGEITFGATPPPVKLYQGKTGRSALREALGQQTSNCHGGNCSSADGKDDSLGNEGRGDRI